MSVIYGSLDIVMLLMSCLVISCPAITVLILNIRQIMVLPQWVVNSAMGCSMVTATAVDSGYLYTCLLSVCMKCQKRITGRVSKFGTNDNLEAPWDGYDHFWHEHFLHHFWPPLRKCSILRYCGHPYELPEFSSNLNKVILYLHIWFSCTLHCFIFFFYCVTVILVCCNACIDICLTRLTNITYLLRLHGWKVGEVWSLISCLVIMRCQCFDCRNEIGTFWHS